MNKNILMLECEKNDDKSIKLKRLGFTLVELLAVIVVLTVILVIAVPKMVEVLYSYKKNVFINNSNAIVSHVKKLYQNENIGSLNSQVLIYNIENDAILNNGFPVDLVERKIDRNGFIRVNYNGETKIAIENDKFCARKEFEEAAVTVVNKTKDLVCVQIYVTLKVKLKGLSSINYRLESYN